MKHFRPRFISIAFAIITYLLSCVGATQAGMLCFGEDGHISMDAAPAFLPAGFHGVNTHTDDTEQTPGHCDDDCNACYDIPISASHVQNTAPHNDGFQIALIPSAAFWDAVLPSSARTIANSTLYDPTLLRNKTVSALRTVVLLI